MRDIVPTLRLTDVYLPRLTLHLKITNSPAKLAPIPSQSFVVKSRLLAMNTKVYKNPSHFHREFFLTTNPAILIHTATSPTAPCI
jgi:hypothetical protein